MARRVSSDIQELTCAGCNHTKPVSNFQGRGRTVINGVCYKYRSEYCRKCFRAIRLQLGLCPNCLRNARCVNGFSKCQKCMNTQRVSLLSCRDRDKEAALQRYGRACRYCGQSKIIFLTVDHIDGGGRKLRKSSTYDNAWGWLRRHNYPNDVQILCYNCNNSKSFLGERRLLELLQQHSRLSESGAARLNELKDQQ